jgi:hypothetical protein
MAETWLWRDGDNPTTGAPLAKLPLADCVAKLGVRPHHHCGDLSTPPRFKRCVYPPATGIQLDMGSTSLRGYQHVVMRLDEAEAHADKWEPGFYRCPVSPNEACVLFEQSRVVRP